MTNHAEKQAGYYVKGGVFQDKDYTQLKCGNKMWHVGPFRTKEAAGLVCEALALDWADEQYARFYVEDMKSLDYWVLGGRYVDTTFQKFVAEKEERYGPFENYEQAREIWHAKSMEQIDDCMVRYRVEKTAGRE